jgi:ribosomal protein S18 acetylase RimI-like enzyme
MKLVDITKDNWEDVIFLTTNEAITVKGSEEPFEVKGMPSLCENHVASNALSIVQSVYEDGWVIKAIEHEGELIGFTMFGWCEEEGFYELCRFMIDIRYQNKRYVYMLDGEIAAMIKISGNMLDIAAVKPSCQGKGIGRELVKFAVNRILENGNGCVKLWCVVGNSKARKLYESLGFEETGRADYAEKKY